MREAEGGDGRARRGVGRSLGALHGAASQVLADNAAIAVFHLVEIDPSELLHDRAMRSLLSLTSHRIIGISRLEASGCFRKPKRGFAPAGPRHLAGCRDISVTGYLQDPE